MYFISFMSQTNSALLVRIENVPETSYLPVIWTIIGAIAAQGFAFWLKYTADIRAAKRKTTADLHQEFNSTAMSKIRNDAWRYAYKNILHTMETQSGHKPQDAVDESVWLLSIMRFYHRLALLQKESALTDNLVRPWFGRIYVWWYIYYLDNAFKEWGGVHRDLENFFNWLREQAKETPYHSDQTDTWHAWVKDALAERDGDIMGKYAPIPDDGRKYY